MFLAQAAHLKAKLKKLYFIGALLQENTWSCIFISIPSIFGILLFPEYKKYWRKLIRLV